MRSAIAIPFLEVSVFDDWRERTCAAKPSHGMPPHVTLLFPFAASPVDGALVPEIAKVLVGFVAFDVSFATIGRFPGTLWLVPDPVAPLVALSRAFEARFQAWPPYGGAFGEPVPHLTVAQGEDLLLDEAETELAARLPITARATEVVLLEEREADHWWWRASFPLAEAAS